MTEKDKKLIEQGEDLSYTEWEKAFDLAEEADSDEAKKRLIRIGRDLNHKEEYYAGSL